VSDKNIDRFETLIKIKRLNKRFKDFAKLCRVSESSVSRAMAGEKNMRLLLQQIDERADKMLKQKGLIK
jgi:hypothetical protein